MTTKEKQMLVDYKEFLGKLKSISMSTDEDNMIPLSVVDAVVVEYTMKIEALEGNTNG